jgi:hypothetical protein
MKPIGRHPIRFPSKRDFHPPKGWINWWESEINNDETNKAREKEKIKKEIKEELENES